MTLRREGSMTSMVMPPLMAQGVRAALAASTLTVISLAISLVIFLAIFLAAADAAEGTGP